MKTLKWTFRYWNFIRRIVYFVTRSKEIDKNLRGKQILEGCKILLEKLEKGDKNEKEKI